MILAPPGGGMYGPTVLLVGEDPETLTRRASILAVAGHDVETAVGHDRGILACAARTFDVIVIEAHTEFEAEKLALDIAVVAPCSEIVNVNRWHNAGLARQDEPGFLLSLLAAAVQPAIIHDEIVARRSHGRRRSSR
jgi:hypothetical protein